MADTFIWYELMTPDQEAATAFYKAVVGWTAEDQINPVMGGLRYTIFSAGGHGVGGAMQLTEAMSAGGARPGWIGYIGVADTDAKAREIVGAGGRELMAPGDIPGVGRFAMLADPGGAPFYLLTPLPRDDAPPPAGLETPGHVGWHELCAGDGQERAFAFYAAHFGWETVDTMDMGAMGQYRLVGADGKAFGALMDKPGHIPAPHWGFYFNVEGIDAAIGRIGARGGEILMGPHEVPGGSWIVQARDPQGASFHLVSPTR